MIEIKFNPNDNRYMFMVGDEKELKLLEAHLNKIPSFMFLPSFSGPPRAEVFLNHFKKDFKKIYYTYIGLWQVVYVWARDNNIELTGLDPTKFKREMNLSLEGFIEVVDSWGLKFRPRPYQFEAAYKILQWNSSCSVLATRAGKTLMNYLVLRYLIETNQVKKVLMIVPSVTLVRQGFADFNDYAEFFKTECIWAGGEEVDSSNMTIGTFQSLIKKLDKKSKKYNPKWFEQFDVVIVDEMHTAKSISVKTLVEAMPHVKMKFGMTGTLAEKNSIDYYTTGTLLGATIQTIRAKDLMDGGFITPIHITQIHIDHSKHVSKDILIDKYIESMEYLIGEPVIDIDGKKKKLTNPEIERVDERRVPRMIKEIKESTSKEQYYNYLLDNIKSKGSNLLNLEKNLVHHLDKRIEVIGNLLSGPIDKNCLVLSHSVEYSKYLYKTFSEKFPNRKHYMIIGSVNAKKRDEIIKLLAEENDAILWASYGCMSTGITLKNLHFGIFSESFKSHIIIQQSLGRGLGASDGKEVYKVYDIVDILPSKKLESHGKARRTIYKEQEFKCIVSKE